MAAAKPEPKHLVMIGASRKSPQSKFSKIAVERFLAENPEATIDYVYEDEMDTPPQKLAEPRWITLNESGAVDWRGI